MPSRQAPGKRAPAKSARTSASKKPQGTFTAEERAAMRERAREVKMAGDKAALEKTVVARIAAMKEPDRTMARRIHTIVKASAPALAPRLWYGMPAYARDGQVLCYFQDAKKFKTRYSTFGFSDKAHLDDGAMWPVAFALRELTSDVEAAIAALVRKAVTGDEGR